MSSLENATRAGHPFLPQVPKVLGADVELSNFMLGMSATEGTGLLASRWLLDEIDGISSGAGYGEPRDMGRKYLPATGGCAYIDSGHLELALPETLSAFDHVAHWRAMLAVARDAMTRVNRSMPAGCELYVLANCSDGLGNSYGSHVNVLLTRRAWNDIFVAKPHYLAYLAAFQISSLVITGQGKVGAERNRTPAAFQLSQRADFVETLVHADTMVQRGVLNTRDEPLCGPWHQQAGKSLARLHVIFYDSPLCQVATVLRVGMLQMVTAMLEAGVVNPRLAFEDPLAALTCVSRDPDLGHRAPLVDGSTRTAVELQQSFLDEARRFADRGGFDGVVPEASRLLALWESTLDLLAVRDVDGLSRRLDWVLKRRVLQGVLDRRPDLHWASPEIRQLDQLYASLDETAGLFWPIEAAGQVDRVVTDDAIALARRDAPHDTRAWTRTQLLRLAGAGQIAGVDWDKVRFRSTPSRRAMTVSLATPHADGRGANQQHFPEGASLESALAALGALEDPQVYPRIVSANPTWPM